MPISGNSGRLCVMSPGRTLGAAAFRDGRADALRQLGADVAVLALPLEQERRGHQPLGADREHRDGRLALDLALLGEHAGAARAQHDARPRHAAHRVQRLVRARQGVVAGDEDQREVRVVRPAPLEGLERGGEGSVVEGVPDGETGSGGNHGWTLPPWQ